MSSGSYAYSWAWALGVVCESYAAEYGHEYEYAVVDLRIIAAYPTFRRLVLMLIADLPKLITK